MVNNQSITPWYWPQSIMFQTEVWGDSPHDQPDYHHGDDLHDGAQVTTQRYTLTQHKLLFCVKVRSI